jgi:hypothetical protein
MTASTNAALARRAVGMARWLDRRSKDLIEATKKQNIAFTHDGLREHENVSMPLPLIAAIVTEMHELRAEIRKFKVPKGTN